MRVLLENLTQDSVNVLIITTDEHDELISRWRGAYQNDMYGRDKLKQTLFDYPKQFVEVMDVWGDTPTVVEPEHIEETPTKQMPSIEQRIVAIEAALFEMAGEIYG